MPLFRTTWRSGAALARETNAAKRKTRTAGRMAAARSDLRGLRRRRGRLILALALLHVELRLALVRREGGQHDMDVPADQLGVRVGMAHPCKVHHRPLHDLESELRVCHLAAPELQAQLNLVAVVKELLGVAQLCVEVILRDARRALDL